MNILNRYSVIGGIILIIVVASYMYLGDYRSLLESNPDSIAILIDYEQNNRLEFIMRGTNWDVKREVLRWRYDEKYSTLYINQYIAARSQWQVKTRAGTLQNRSYIAGTPLYYEEVDNLFRVVKISNYQAGHTLTETNIFTENISIENFPERYYATFVPGKDNEYELIWKISNIEILPEQKQGMYNSVCTLNFGKNVKVDWCRSKDKVNYVYLSKQYNALYVHFKSVVGVQSLDVSLVDPILDTVSFERIGDSIQIDNTASVDMPYLWVYPKEVVTVPYKEAYMPFSIEHMLPFSIDPCKNNVSFETTYPSDTEISWDHMVSIGNYDYVEYHAECIGPYENGQCPILGLEGEEFRVCDVEFKKNICTWNELVFNGTYSYKERTRWVSILDLESCVMEPNIKYNFRHLAVVPVNEHTLFDVNLVIDIPVRGRFVYTIPKPEWISTAPADFNTGTAFDFNWTMVTSDGNVMPTGSDKIYVEQNQAFYDNNLLMYFKFDDVNAEGGIIDDTNNNVNGYFYLGNGNVESYGLWDTNAYHTEGSGYGIGTFYNPNDLNEFTISLWFKPVLLSGTRYFADSSNGSAGFGARMGGGYEFFVYCGGDPSVLETTVTTPTSGRWDYVTFVHSFDNKIYVNGLLEKDGPSYCPGGGMTASNSTMGIGAEYLPQRGGASGFMDEFKMYSRALTADEIKQDYESWMNSDYLSPVKDAGGVADWDDMTWQETTDVNNSITVDYRGCSTSDCSIAGEWQTSLSGGGITYTDITADGNQYFQYRTNFDTNSVNWNRWQEGDTNSIFGKFTNMVINYTLTATDSCSCPASGYWEINDSSICTLSDTCNLSAGGLNITDGSLTVTVTGTLVVPTGYSINIEKGGSAELVVVDGGKVVIVK